MHEVIRDTAAMLAGLAPSLSLEDFVFCSTADPMLAARAAPVALGLFTEKEGFSLILECSDAHSFGFPTDQKMRRITLEVHSALDGIGLTASVSGVLAAHAIACNMVAAFHHDHVFVPSHQAEAAMDALALLQAEALAGSRKS